MTTSGVAFLLILIISTVVQCQQFLEQSQRFGTPLPQQQFLRQQQRNRFMSRSSGIRGGQFTSPRGSFLPNLRVLRPQVSQIQRDNFVQRVQRDPLDQRQQQQGLEPQNRQQRLSQQLPQQLRLQSQDPQQRQDLPSSASSRLIMQDQRRQSNGQDGRIDRYGRIVPLYPGERETFIRQQRGDVNRRFISSSRRMLPFPARNQRRQFVSADSEPTFDSSIQGSFSDRNPSSPALSEKRSRGFPGPSPDFATDRFSTNFRTLDRDQNQWSNSRRQQQQMMMRKQRGDEILRQRQLEKERDGLLKQHRKNDEELRRQRIVLQQEQQKEQQLQQQLEQQIRDQQPLVPSKTGNSSDISLTEPNMSAPPSNLVGDLGSVTLEKDPVQVKRERIQQLADLLGFRPHELFNVVAELEANKNSLVTDALAKAAQKSQPPLTEKDTTMSPVAHTSTDSSSISNAWDSISTDNKVTSASKSADIASTTAVIIGSAATGVTGSMSHGSVATGVTGSPFHGSFATGVTESLSRESSTTFGGAVSTIPNESKINDLIRQMVIDMLTNKQSTSKTGLPLPSFDSSLPKDVVTSFGGSATHTSPFPQEERPQTPPHAQIGNTPTVSPINIVNTSSRPYSVGVTPVTSTARVSNSLMYSFISSSPAPSDTGNGTTVLPEKNAQLPLVRSNQVVNHESSTVQTPFSTLNRDELFAAASKALLEEIQKLLGASNVSPVSGPFINNNSSAPEKNNSEPFANSTAFLPLDILAVHGSPETGASFPFLFALNETDIFNITDRAAGMNVTVTTPLMTTEATNTTAAPTEATEPVPTAPPPPPGFPHMFVPLPGQELTEAQLEYNEMREALMAK